MAQYGVSFVATFTAYDTTAGTYKTGDSANITLQWTKDGTDAATTNACSEVDATNSPGLYKVTITAAEATCTAGNLSGKSSTGTNIIISPRDYLFDTYANVMPVGVIAALGIVDNGTLQAATGTTARLRSAAAFADSELVGHTLSITGGTGVGQSRLITAYSAATDACTVDTWTTTPDSTSTYIVYPTPPASATSLIPVDLQTIKTQAVTAAAGVTFPTSIASPTNITAGTITTVTSVTALAGSAGIKKNTAKAGFPFLMTDDTNHEPAPGLTVTAERSLDGAAFAACANAVAEISDGVYKIDLAAGDLNGNTVCLKFAATGADQQTITVVTGP